MPLSPILLVAVVITEVGGRPRAVLVAHITVHAGVCDGRVSREHCDLSGLSVDQHGGRWSRQDLLDQKLVLLPGESLLMRFLLGFFEVNAVEGDGPTLFCSDGEQGEEPCFASASGAFSLN